MPDEAPDRVMSDGANAAMQVPASRISANQKPRVRRDFLTVSTLMATNAAASGKTMPSWVHPSRKTSGHNAIKRFSTGNSWFFS